MKDGTIYRYEKPDPEWEKKGNHEMDEKELAYYESLAYETVETFSILLKY